jgi:hypothetical protein
MDLIMPTNAIVMTNGVPTVYSSGGNSPGNLAVTPYGGLVALSINVGVAPNVFCQSIILTNADARAFGAALAALPVVP